MTDTNSELENIHNLKVFKAATRQAEYAKISEETITRFQKNWEADLLSWRNREVEEAIVEREIKIHDDYWHMQNAVAKEGIGPIALRLKDAAKAALLKIRAAHSSRREAK